MQPPFELMNDVEFEHVLSGVGRDPDSHWLDDFLTGADVGGQEGASRFLDSRFGPFPRPTFTQPKSRQPIAPEL